MNAISANHRVHAGLHGIIMFWLDEEWTPLQVHKDIASATAESYVKVMRGGASDMADIVLAMSSELQACDFGESFVNAFEVSNKVVELMMQRQGIDVCCTSDQDATLIERYAQAQAAG